MKTWWFRNRLRLWFHREFRYYKQWLGYWIARILRIPNWTDRLYPDRKTDAFHEIRN